MSTQALHYGQALFEGLKAFETKDKDIRVFRSDENAKRMEKGCMRLGIPCVTQDLFNEMVDTAIRDNVEYVPPYGTNGSLYLRPFLFGHGPQLGLGKASSYIFGVVSNPVGNYYPQGPKPVSGAILPNFDRAAPHGIGAVKTAGNYAADIVPATKAHEKGYTILLYLDAATNRYIEEFSTSNFIGITADNKFVTPDSHSILCSVTNLSLQQVAKDMGMDVEVRPIELAEIESFKEVAACGTAVVITPLKDLTDERSEPHTKYVFGDGNFPVMMNLYNRVRAIQNGEAQDTHGWCRLVTKRS